MRSTRISPGKINIVFSFLYCYKITSFPSFNRNHLNSDADVRKGVVNDTPLLDVPNFDVIWDVPLDEFHLIKEGLTKLMLDRMGFASLNIDGPRRDGAGRRHSHAREVLIKLNHAYCNMAVFSETCRRPRPLKLGQLKGKFYQTFQ